MAIRASIATFSFKHINISLYDYAMVTASRLGEFEESLI